MTTEKAHAKLNLTLDIVGRRKDGYHLLSMIMQSISLADTIRVEKLPQKEIRIHCGKGAPCDKRNTAFRAAEQFFAFTGLKNDAGAEIFIEKHIPSQAGMGGGSSDAAAVLRALNRLYGTRLSVKQLQKIGESVGADVPFCITGGTLRAEGIGEILTSVSPMPNCWFVLCKPPLGISTPAAFKKADSEAYGSSCAQQNMEKALASKNLSQIGKTLFNRFEEILQVPQIENIQKSMMNLGALGACMTGSGSVVFGIFEEENQARKAAQELNEQGKTWVCTPISRYYGK